ncbi:FG-GAP-like repeat-containing protein [Acidobacterium sp. S8]|uniref:FG-GAP-like repeat-containing protein n=1 Tax=Acidobacterium sp. S8 TaxID=1641854 RepID=UPI001C201B66|nr:FG-GAP-like repeat-containing protein [Acidobacterium sp. S8]
MDLPIVCIVPPGVRFLIAILQEFPVSLPRMILTAVLFATAGAATCVAQVPVSFSNNTSPTATTGHNVYAVDVNNDGIPDMIQDRSQAPNGFTISIANGDGTFRSPVTYTVLGGGSLSPIAYGDFNGDGKVDLILALTGTNQLAVFLGKGDGTFQAPKYSTINFPSAEMLDAVPIAAADFNQDGKLDLVAAASNATTQTLFVITGDGAGGFVASESPIPIYNPFAGTTVDNIALGDFDSNDKTDVAFTVATLCSNGGNCGTALHVLYNNGGIADFEDTTPYTSTGLFTLSSGDLNSDGLTDLFGIDHATNQLALFYGQGSRTFTSYFSGLPNNGVGNSPHSLTGELAMADFNDDGLMDLVAMNASGQARSLLFFLAGADPGQFTQQLVSIGSASSATNLIAGNFNEDTKPDIGFVQNSVAAPSINAFINSTSHGVWSDCDYPKQGRGISLCAPTGSTTSQLSFNAAANSFGQIRKMELWVDGVKVQEQHNTWGNNAWFNFITDYNPGTHNATLFAADIDNTLQKLDFNFTVGPAPCAAPSSLGVNICTPASGTSVGSPVLVEASANIDGGLQRMEVWVDGVKKFTEFSGPFLGASIVLPAGTHQFVVYAVNFEGVLWEGSVTATVK